MEFEAGLFKLPLPAFRVPCSETLQRDVVWKMGSRYIERQPAWRGGRFAACVAAVWPQKRAGGGALALAVVRSLRGRNRTVCKGVCEVHYFRRFSAHSRAMGRRTVENLSSRSRLFASIVSAAQTPSDGGRSETRLQQDRRSPGSSKIRSINSGAMLARVCRKAV
ncbi:MAG: hypothetical protein R3F04_03355 [Lysobacteraceae bacterium]